MVKSRIAAFPSSGEINLKLDNPGQAIEKVESHYKPLATSVDYTDGLSMAFVSDDASWRFNLRSSNTEPVVRLNVESKADGELVALKLEELKGLLK
jgi:phosphomannomutase